MTSRNELNDKSITPYYWVPCSIISGIFTIYMLVYSIIYTDGFMRTCNQYRHELVKSMQLSGNQVAALRGRLSCAAILDFMDFLHQDFSYERRREGRINTPAAIIIALTFAWLSVAVWFYIFIVNVRQSRASRSVRVWVLYIDLVKFEKHHQKWIQVSIKFSCLLRRLDYLNSILEQTHFRHLITNSCIQFINDQRNN